MYRELITTIDQVQSLEGKLVRMEYGTASRVGIIEPRNRRTRTHYVEFRDHRDRLDALRVVQGTWPVYLTTSDCIRENEEPLIDTVSEAF